MYLGLAFSSRFNNLIFSTIVNPYDPLTKKTHHPESTRLTNENVDTSEYWRDPRGLFPIFAFDSPDSTKDLVASLKIMEKGGINILINGNLSWIPFPYKVKEAFEKLGYSNLKWLPILTNECHDDWITANTNDNTNDNLKKYFNEFDADYIYGWYLWDEPGRNREACAPLNLVPNDDNADINRIVKQIRSDSIFKKKLDFVNLFPTYWEGTPDIISYEKYIDTFISSQEFKPRVLCFDHYPLLKKENGGFRKDYYANLAVIRKKSLQYKIPFWTIILSSEHLGYKKPTFEEISLQVYSSLAYGAKGFGYYLYSKSFADYGYKSWILEDYVDDETVLDSLHGPLYVSVRRLNEEVQVLGKTLINLESIEIIHSSNYPNSQKDISQTILDQNNASSLVQNVTNYSEVISDPRILIGVFANTKGESPSRKYLLIVNKDVNVNANVKIELNKLYNVFKFVKKPGAISKIASSKSFSLQLAPGSGELYFLE